MPALLPSDASHPRRPDLPILRHLTYSEAHAAEIGIGLAVLVWWSQVGGFVELVIPIAIALVRLAVGMKRKSGTDTCDHTLGVHDIRAEPQWFASAAILTYVVLAGAWRLLGVIGSDGPPADVVQ